MTDESFGPAVCRVCLSGESSIPYNGKKGGEPLISPCDCKGYAGLLHKSCLEHWLYMSKTTQCEICKYHFKYATKLQSICDYFRQSGWDSRGMRSLPADFFSVFIFTPIALVLIYYCIKSGIQDINDSRFPTGEIIAMLLVAFLIFTTIFVWYILTIIFHAQQFFEWQETHKLVYLADRQEYDRSRSNSIITKIAKTLCCYHGIQNPQFVMSARELERAATPSGSSSYSYSSSISPQSTSSLSNVEHSSIVLSSKDDSLSQSSNNQDNGSISSSDAQISEVTLIQEDTVTFRAHAHSTPFYEIDPAHTRRDLDLELSPIVDYSPRFPSPYISLSLRETVV